MSSASLLWCHSGVSTVRFGERIFTLVAGDLLFAPEEAQVADDSQGLVLNIRFETLNIMGPARRIHLGHVWNDRLTFEYSRSLFGKETLSPDIARLFTDRVPTPPLPAPRKARAVAQVLVSNPADQTSLEEFAEIQGVSARTLQRQFLKSTGYSFSEWRAAQRVCVAAEPAGPRLQHFSGCEPRRVRRDQQLDQSFSTPHRCNSVHLYYWTDRHGLRRSPTTHPSNHHVCRSASGPAAVDLQRNRNRHHPRLLPIHGTR